MKSKEEKIKELKHIGVKFKETGKEEEALDNLYSCPECFGTYEYCECEKGLKTIITSVQEIKKLTEDYKWGLRLKPSQARNQFLKDISEIINYWKSQINI